MSTNSASHMVMSFASSSFTSLGLGALVVVYTITVV
jgi:hypothetical protein